MKTFKRLSDKVKVDLALYVKDYLKINPQVEILIGTDSQIFDKITRYATVVVLYFPRNGGHVLFNTINEPNKYREQDRLWEEVMKSVEIAEYLQKEIGAKAKYLDLDLNPDPKYMSNEILRAAVGYVEAMGYHTRTKHNENYSIYIADKLCR